MKYLKYTLILSFLLLASCLGEQKQSKNRLVEEDVATNNQETKKNDIDIEAIKNRLCSEFPKDLVLKYNPEAVNIVIEPIDNGSGGILHCDVKLFYGKKDYEFWKGQVSAWVNMQENPFWQYNPERNATLYHKIDELGDKAVFISNMSQLQILKDGVLYTITPPNNGNRTSSGKETKAIAVEIANHYKL